MAKQAPKSSDKADSRGIPPHVIAQRKRDAARQQAEAAAANAARADKAMAQGQRQR